jgi:L-alanine-DL-glutamate epimerase-like enolase superfamily enzyme
MKIVDVEAVWLSAPLESAVQHTSDFGRIKSFDSVLVTVVTDTGLRGIGEAKAGVGSAAHCAALVTLVREEMRPQLLGEDPRDVQRLWTKLYNGSRAAHAERSGRSMPILGRRGLHMCALSGVDLALWDVLGKALGAPVLELVGGPCRERITAYASGGWGDVERIGAELTGYVELGFRAVKMRIGAMDGSVERSLARVRAARRAIGPDVALMVDAHGTLGVAEAKHFCAQAAGLDLRWLEEPVSSDDRAGLREVRDASTIPIAAGESESTCFEFQDLLARGALDVLQPDLAICGGLSEGLRIAALAVAHQRQLAPHCWGSAISFVAAQTLALHSPAGVFVEYPMGADPLLRELPVARPSMSPREGSLARPTGPGWGLELQRSVIEKYARTA